MTFSRPGPEGVKKILQALPCPLGGQSTGENVLFCKRNFTLGDFQVEQDRRVQVCAFPSNGDVKMGSRSPARTAA